MYNARVRAELFDSLDYLIPPVKKNPRALYKGLPYKDVKLTDHSFLRNCHRTVFANTLSSKTSESDLQTSSSLVLKKNRKQLIYDQYSIFNLSSCHRGSDLFIQTKSKPRNLRSNEDKAIIKVTVIPKVKETQTYKVFNKRCKCSKKVQTTVSNQDNSIKNQNIYLLIKGRKSEKIHELKTSESAKLSNINIHHKYGDISLEQISESRQIINSLNMEKRKRKENKNKKAGRTYVCDDRKSRVTVVGQLGLAQDRYVLTCAAAANDKPNDERNPNRLTNNSNFHQTSSQYRPTRCDINNCEILKQFRQHDSDVQTDIANPFYSRDTPQDNRAASQSTQVNFNFPNQSSLKQFRNQTAQCSCDRATTANNIDIEAGHKVLKECKSPLVIISVYPRQDKGTDENDTVKIIQRQTSPERKEVTNVTRSNTQKKKKQSSPGKLYTTNKVDSKLYRSRSPSPANKNENKTDTRENNNMSTKKGLQSGSHKSYVINNLQDHTSCHCNRSTFLKTEDLNRLQNKIKTNKSNTEEVKKALVNSFLRNVNVMDKDNRKSRSFQPKGDASKVSINIDGVNDRYDVLLEHSPLNTGVSVRKTTKPRPLQSCSSEEEVNIKSLENFLLVSNERMKKDEYNKETGRTLPPAVLKIKPTCSRLNIKDSIEISRRQGEHSNYRLKSRLKSDKNNFGETQFNSNFYAPVKHYRGDDCLLSDPNERDREVRELLGITRCHRIQNTEFTDSRSTKQVGCCCRKKCSAGLMTGLSISKFLTSKCMKRRNKKVDTQNETTQIEPSDVKDKPEPSQKEHKSNISKKIRNTEKSEHKRVSEAPDEGKVSEEETSESPETTTEEDSKEPEDTKRENSAHENAASRKEKTISKSASKKDPSKKELSKKELSKKELSKKELSKKEPSKKEDHEPTLQLHDKNLILNRNIQIFLQVEQFNRERPVVLTRKQYEKVKRIIECTISKKLSIEKRKRCSLKNCNVVSIGEIKVRPKLQLPLRLNREIQTDGLKSKNPADVATDKNKVKNGRGRNSKNIKIQKLDNHITTGGTVTERHNGDQVYPRHTVSSVEIRYASVEYKKRVVLSPWHSRFKNDIIHSLRTSDVERNSNSIHTIFKGHKRCATPNLGTSAFSLYSNVSDFSNKSYKQPQCAGDFKPKKPFLQRLISCLVMRSTQTSNVKNVAQKRKMPSVNSSLDSYHISTSLGAIEMTSSLYDTSASFYTNHTTMRVNKIKRGFFSSVRGFLTSRRS